METWRPGLEGSVDVHSAQRRKGVRAEETIVCVTTWPLGRDKELCVTANEEGRSETRKAWRAQPTGTCCSSHRQGCRLSHSCPLALSDQWHQIWAPRGPLCTVRQHHLCAAPGPCTPVSTAGAQLEVVTGLQRSRPQGIRGWSPGATASLSVPGLVSQHHLLI